MGCVGPVGQTTNGRLGAHHLIIRTLIYCWISHGWRLLGRISCETHAQSTVMRVMHVKLPSICSWPLCRESGFAMRLRLPGPEPRNVSPEAVFATPMRLGLSNVSSQCDPRLYPRCLRNASAPPNASSQCVWASQCVCAFQCVNASAPPNVSAPIRPFLDECVLAMRLHLQVVCHTPPGHRNVYSV